MRLRLSVLALLTLVFTLPSGAQSADPFGAWMILPDTAQLVYLDANGTAGDLTLPLPDGYAHVSQDEFAVSPNGQTIAYVVYRAGYTQPAVAIYGIQQRSLLADFAPAGMLFTSLSVARLHAFSADSRQLAIGYLTEAGWELAVVDLQTFALAGRLTDTTPGLDALPRTPDSLPVPLDFRAGNRLAFTVYDLSVTRAERYPAYLWELVTGALTTTSAYETPVVDVFPATGEVIRAGVDARLPLSDAFLPDAHYNVLWRYSPALGTAAPIYTEPEWSLTAARFVRNGATLLVGATDGFQTRYKLIDRGGALVADVPETQRVYDAIGTRTGFLYVTLNSQSAPTVIHVDLSGGASSALWTGEVSASTPLLLWVGSSDPLTPYFSDAGDYTLWAELAPAISETGNPITAIDAGSPTQVPQSALTIGGKATIATSNGDALNVRSYFGTQYEIRAKARPGEVVDVLDGPRDADGFTWWYIRLADGRAGWAVASADDKQTLVPGENSVPLTDQNAPASPSLSSGLSVGDMAAVDLPETLDSLRLRNGPGLSFEIVLLLPDATLLRIIGGPERVDDLTWWEVRTPEGNVGWAAEVIGAARVLVRQ
ncbi:MAG: SH3 domain-containing protein [Chloroflexi bacterium]|nr:SH3 domain-containing protein [Chloroflexota bacterium]